MNRKPISKEDRQALSEMLDDGYTYKQMAAYMEVCTDTLKRILVREGLANFDGAKYAIAPSHKSQQKIWERKCLKCKKLVTLPKWQYICDRCTAINESIGLHDDYIFADVADGTPMSERKEGYEFSSSTRIKKGRPKFVFGKGAMKP